MPKNVKKKSKKPKNRRENEANPNLNPRFNLKTRSDLIDFDYLDKLNPKELAFLNQFVKEEINAGVDKNPKKNRFNKTKKDVKRCYDKNNARNRDVLSRAKASKQLLDMESELVVKLEINPEETLINELDKESMLEAINWISSENEKDELNLEKSLILSLKDKEES